MNKTLRKRHDAQKKAHGVATGLSDVFATDGAKKNVATLGSTVADVAGQATEQEQARIDRQDAVADCRTLRRVLRGEISLVVKVSALVKLEESDAKEMQSPDWGSDDNLLFRARAILNTATVHAERFVAEGLPPDFLTMLASQIDRFAAAKARVSDAVQRFAAATETIHQRLSMGKQAIGVLEGLLVNAPNAPDGALVQLRQAKRIGPRVKEAPATASSTPAPAATPEPKAA